MVLLPRFYKAVWPCCSSEKHFREQFMAERSRQYETNSKVKVTQQKFDFKKDDNHAACGKFFITTYIPKANYIAILTKHLEELVTLKSNLKKIKIKIIEEDQHIFDKSGRRLHPGKSVHHDFNSTALKKLDELNQDISAFMSRLDKKLDNLKSIFKGMAFKPFTSKSRKR